MIFGKTKIELKVGIFVFIGIIILTIFVLSVGKFRTLAAGYNISFIFHFVNGVKVGAPVRFSGVDVGEVKKINFKFSQAEQKFDVEVIAWVKKPVQIPADSTIWVNTLGLLGEKYIEIMPGKDYQHCIPERGSLVGVDPIPMHEVVRLGKEIADNIDATLIKIKKGEGTIGKLIVDDTIYKELEALSIDLRKHPWKLFWKSKGDPVKKPEKKPAEKEPQKQPAKQNFKGR